jgi:hypothetical protein
MFKKFMMSSLVFCLFIVQANAATHNGLKSAFEELNYSLNVEWDQVDKSFYNQAQEKFASSLRDLQAQGLTNQELIQFALSEVKDEKIQRDLEAAFNMITISKMSQIEAHAFITEVLSKSQAKGASWNGGSAIATILVLALFVAVALVVSGNARVENGCYQVYRCDDYCTGGVCYQDCYYECI